MQKSSLINLIGSPWLFAIPISVFIVALFVHQSSASQVANIERNFASAMKTKIESLEKFIGSRSGENSAKAADQQLNNGQPVFFTEIQEIKRATDRLVEGPDFGGGYEAAELSSLTKGSPWESAMLQQLMSHGMGRDEATARVDEKIQRAFEASKIYRLKTTQTICVVFMVFAVVVASLIGTTLALRAYGSGSKY